MPTVEINRILNRVEKPLRYLGDEYNVVKKDWEKTPVRSLFAFPDLYEVGMSHLGLKIIYNVVNQHPDMLMERVFTPWVDMEEELRNNNISLFSLENQKPINEFDVIGFTLQYEMTFTNILNILDLGKIPKLSEERGDEDPLIIAGGPCVYNPEPMADFIDVFIIGDGEEIILELLEEVRRNKKKNKGKMEKKSLLKDLMKISGLYIPSFYKEDENGIAHPIVEGAPFPIVKRTVQDLDKASFPLKPIVPYIETVHDRAMVEVLRGCNRGCRFCHAGIVYRPVRERSKEVLIEQVKEIIKNTGYDDVAFTSLSTSDYSGIQELIRETADAYSEKGIGISLPSLRVDNFSVGIAKEVSRVRKTSLTFAPEAGTQRMRDIINKGVTEEEMLEVARAAFTEGWQHIKLYFMIGLPWETEEDVLGIVDLARKVLAEGDKVCQDRRQKPRVTISVASFIPKSHTPFQWVPQDTLKTTQEKQMLIRRNIRNKRIVFDYHDGELALIEGIFARGNRKVGKALLKAFEKGCKLDSWRKFFDNNKWLEALSEAGCSFEEYNFRERGLDEVFPWDIINTGVRKTFLASEYKKAAEAELTGDCRYTSCSVCGICQDLPVKIDYKGDRKIEIKSKI